MYFSSKLLSDLVVNTACLHNLDTDIVQNLIYHLHFPGEEVPVFIADVIADSPSVTHSSHFPGRLAFGIVDTSLMKLDISARYSYRARLCRQVQWIRLALAKIEYPVKIIDTFANRLSLLVFASEAANDLGSKEQELSNAELATLVERIIEAELAQAQLTERVLDRVVKHLKRAEKDRLSERIKTGVTEGLDNEPWNDLSPLLDICDINEPICFRQSLFQQDNFPEAAWGAMTYLNALCKH